jgi:hypothetical protein
MKNNASCLHNIYQILRKLNGLAVLTICFVLESHATAATGSTAPSSSSSSSSSSSAHSGYLQVFSATEQARTGEDTYYYPHTGYRIYDSSGQVVKWVENHDSAVDETPKTVELKPGTYTIWALADSGHYVKTPVKIKPARTTTVELENASGEKKS